MLLRWFEVESVTARKDAAEMVQYVDQSRLEHSPYATVFPLLPSNLDRDSAQCHITGLQIENMISRSYVYTQREAKDDGNNSTSIPGIQTISPPTSRDHTQHKNIPIRKARTPQHHSTPRLLYDKETHPIDSTFGIALCRASLSKGCLRTIIPCATLVTRNDHPGSNLLSPPPQVQGPPAPPYRSPCMRPCRAMAILPCRCNRIAVHARSGNLNIRLDLNFYPVAE
jgi:hypothetical protein